MKTVEQLIIILSPNDSLTKSHQVSVALLITLGAGNEKPEGGGMGRDMVKLIVVMENLRFFCMKNLRHRWHILI